MKFHFNNTANKIAINIMLLKNISKAKNDLKKHKNVKVKKSVDDTKKYVNDFIKRRRK